MTQQYDSSVLQDYDKLPDNQKTLLTQSKTFCMYPWIHIYASPTGKTYPCCMAENTKSMGSTKTHTLEQIWNSDGMKQLRLNMLSNKTSDACKSCYEKDSAGFYSSRYMANSNHGHHIGRTAETNADGSLDKFEMTYWDVRFSNLCNLSCRTCGHLFSSSWYQDAVKLNGPVWGKNNKPLLIAGKSKNDMWQQVLPHLDYVEEIYFAGGEPLMMDEHYNILDELERRERFDVKLIYNTNFTKTKLKDRSVFDYWKKFTNVSVGASLDAMGTRAEYMRKGTTWDEIERNREEMLRTCPKVDFYISATLSIMNAWHLPDFHRTWADKQLIQPADMVVQVLQQRESHRIDIAPTAYKSKIKHKYEQHLTWLQPHDSRNRATTGYTSAINFMMALDNAKLIPKFWADTKKLDAIRNENILDVIPELKELL